MPTVLLIDGHSQAYRAYFALQKAGFSTRAGEPTTAVYGFASKLLSTLRQYKPDCVAVAFDLGDTFRHAEFSDYKATRERMPDDMRTQMERIQQMLRAFNIPILTYPNYEADDILGVLGKQAGADGYDVLIMSGDRDMFQLVDERVKVLYTSGGPKPVTSIIGPEEVMERYGLTPDQFRDYKAVLGDSSDNIPGIPGVGEKTAIKLIQDHGDIDTLYAHIESGEGPAITPKIKAALVAAKEQIERNRRLVRIVTELDDLHWEPEKCRLADYDQQDVIDFFNEMEIRSLIKELPEGRGGAQAASAADGAAAAGVGAGEVSGQMALFAYDNDEETALDSGITAIAPAEASPYQIIQDESALAQLAETLASATQISFDVETDSTDAMQAKLVGVGVAWAPGQAAYIPIAHTTGTQLPWDMVRAALQPVFANAAVPKMAHNAKYDLTVLLNEGLKVQGQIHDTMVLAFLLDPASRSLGLKAQAAERLGWQMTEITSLIGTGKKQITIDQAPIETVGAYCGADVDATIQLFTLLAPKVKEQEMWELYETIELPLLPVLTDMERTGVLLDTAFLGEMSSDLAARLGEIEEELYKIVGHPFNLRSTQQMSQVLFSELNFPTRNIGKTSSGHFSTAAYELEKLQANSHNLSDDQKRVLELIFTQRVLEKLRGTYVDTLPTLVNPRTGRLHTSFNQAGAVTGRLSSSDPNLQNIPIRTEEGRRIRKAFIVPEGHCLISADYSQVELRILAHVAREESLITAFVDGADIHRATAAKLFRVPIEDVSKNQRDLAKTINFATVYGSSAFGISSRTEMDPKEARQLLDQFFATYPRIKQYIDDTKEAANNNGYVETLLGRKRFFPELGNPKLPMNQRLALERQAINAPIQGSAADIMKLAMVDMHRALNERGMRTRMLLQVHDELVLETPDDEREAAVALVREVMASAYTLSVPLRADVEIGPNWYDQEDA